MPLKLHNTLTRRLEAFEPLEDRRVRLYTCGPTVYNYAHIGNFRAYMFEDILRRHLKASGFAVTQVMNLTDVDDKTIRGARAAGVPLDAFTRTFKDAFFQDLKTLAIEPAEQYPEATRHVAEMIDLIRRLMERGHAYRSEDGSIYFNIATFKPYGKLAHLDLEGLRAGARVAHDEYEKENVADFALWKAWDEADGDVAWDSPWGRGRPGWHIECSAMSMKYLGETFDIHTGGIDNMFPHHENEIAQAEAATGKPFVRCWLHCSHLVVDGQKMSKSLGNFYTLRDVLARGFSGREVRYVLLAAQYRQALNFSFDALQAARASLARLDEFMGRLETLRGGAAPAAAVPPWVEEARRGFGEGMDEDLNVPAALAALFEMVHAGNRAMDAAEVNAAQAACALEALRGFDVVLGVLNREADRPDAEALRLADLRRTARQEKNWKESDRLRDRLASIGWEVRDTPEGQKLKRK